jgi:hypothetical protein
MNTATQKRLFVENMKLEMPQTMERGLKLKYTQALILLGWLTWAFCLGYTIWEMATKGIW